MLFLRDLTHELSITSRYLRSINVFLYQLVTLEDNAHDIDLGTTPLVTLTIQVSFISRSFAFSTLSRKEGGIL